MFSAPIATHARHERAARRVDEAQSRMNVHAKAAIIGKRLSSCCYEPVAEQNRFYCL